MRDDPTCPIAADHRDARALHASTSKQDGATADATVVFRMITILDPGRAVHTTAKGSLVPDRLVEKVSIGRVRTRTRARTRTSLDRALQRGQLARGHRMIVDRQPDPHAHRPDARNSARRAMSSSVNRGRYYVVNTRMFMLTMQRMRKSLCIKSCLQIAVVKDFYS